MLELPAVAIYPQLVVKCASRGWLSRAELFFVDQAARVFLVLWFAFVTLALIYKLL